MQINPNRLNSRKLRVLRKEEVYICFHLDGAVVGEEICHRWSEGKMSQILNKLLRGVSGMTGWIRILRCSSHRASLPWPAQPPWNVHWSLRARKESWKTWSLRCSGGSQLKAELRAGERREFTLRQGKSFSSELQLTSTNWGQEGHWLKILSRHHRSKVEHQLVKAKKGWAGEFPLSLLK